ncbi:hypothetical protein [Modestobacter sp. Leaf380]|uniref:hypothetical protein n=1 Tax=Modestobacter sp. Leaf380 TaxID=1736356 RepID=UPI0006F700FC|nr:hypothetical protein [Modestobacter sp. Leaf380]KQS65854.1 hypothetical protein ASG41_14915 [Modestobacter sp. Leaf380]
MPDPHSPPPTVGVLAKDPWHPAFRREHHLVRGLVARGSTVRFVQAPADVGRVRTDPAGWARHLLGGRFTDVEPGVAVSERSTVLPGSRGTTAERLDAAALRVFLHRSGWAPDLTVVQLPWEWRGTQGSPGRVVFDCTDDWSRLLPHARGLPDQLRRIADEADEVVVVNPVLAPLFPGRRPAVVPNGTDEALLTAPRRRQRRPSTMVYVGTIAERFDVELVRGVLHRLPGWTLQLYGELAFPDRARAAAERFAALLREFPGRCTHHGLLPRSGLADVLDAATVALVPDLPERTLGQSSMKAHDHAARGLPTVATTGHHEEAGEVAPHTRVVTGAGEAADAVLAAATEPGAWADARRDWAAHRTWSHRTDAWLAAAWPAGVRAADR